MSMKAPPLRPAPLWPPQLTGTITILYLVGDGGDGSDGGDGGDTWHSN